MLGWMSIKCDKMNNYFEFYPQRFSPTADLPVKPIDPVILLKNLYQA